MNEINLIYGYLYIPTQKIRYIGRTKNLVNRRKEHEEYDILNPNCREYDYPLSRAIRKYGMENFEVIILEDNLTYEESVIREIYWIRYYDTYNNGYNQTRGGEGVNKYIKFNDDIIKLAKEMIKSQIPFSQISQELGISIPHLSSINNGTRCRDENETYPLNNMTRGRKLTDEQILDIQNLLQNTILKQSQIADLYNISQTCVSKINLGKMHYNENLMYPLRDAYKLPR